MARRNDWRAGRPPGGVWLLVAASALSLAMSVFDYFWTGNGIHDSVGVLLVIISTLLMLLASATIAVGWVHWRWLRIVLAVLIFLDILGSGFAAYMLEAWILLGFIAVALVAWLWWTFAGRPAAAVATSGAAE